MRGIEPKSGSPNIVLRWHIGRESAPLDKPPYRAYFFWLENNRLVGSADFDASELAAEIKRRRETGKDVSEFEAAQTSLAKFNG